MSSGLPPPFLFYFSLPKGKPLIFDKLFKFDDRGTEIVLQTAVQKRSDFIGWLNNPTTPEAGIQLLNEYLPQLMGLAHCIDTQPDLRTYTPMNFTWTAAGQGDYSLGKEIQSPNVNFEVATVHLILGYLHSNAACVLMDAATNEIDYDEKSKKAGAYLRTASGVFEYLQKYLETKWPVMSSADIAARPSDALPQCAQALSYVALAQAQQMAIRKAALNEKMSKKLVAQLCCDTYKKFDQAIVALRPLPPVFMPSLRKMIDLNSCLYRAQCMKFLGVEAYDASSFGLAASYLKTAYAQMRELKIPTDVLWMKAPIEIEEREIRFFAEKFEKENSAVYYEKEVPSDQLEIPQPRALLTAQPYTPVSPAFLQIV